MKKFQRDNRGVALLTVIMVMIIGLVLAALCFYLIGRGNKTYRMSKNYAKAFNLAQGGIEEAVSFLNKSGYYTIDNALGQEKTAASGAKYQIWQLFWKSLSGFGGAPVFPPTSGAYTGVSGTGVYYLIHSQAAEGNAQADLYVMYVKGY